MCARAIPTWNCRPATCQPKKLMEQPGLMEHRRTRSGSERSSDESRYLLSVVLVFEDLATRGWAAQAFERVQRASQMQIQSTEWRIRRLLDEQEFPEAVGAAARADVLAVALRAVEEPPIPLCVWIDAWLPRRLQRPGALLAWIGRLERPGAGPSSAQQYLQAVARRAGLDFLPREARPERRVDLCSEYTL